MSVLVSLFWGIVSAAFGVFYLVLAIKRNKKFYFAAIPILMVAALFLAYTALSVFFVLSID